ncbi:Crp/Fnr family transcriptional regulator [Pedobacter nyackensis]|uniref:Crp/Fnr family transcriptional regulator n=1 Tax=Pedobacter nyackensis TaxID=475255 RepID=UPI00292DA335|nr:Crp/Fnr family transcriptional regulator [Pedobacter nyackensis]
MENHLKNIWRRSLSKRLKIVDLKTADSSKLEALKLYLNSVSLLRESTWERLNLLFSESDLKKGEYFAIAGEFSKKVGFLSNGIIRAFYRNQQGFEYNKHFFIQDQMVGGYASLVSKTVNQINQQALCDCKLWIADYSSITALYNECPDLERLSRRLAELYFVDKERREIEIVLLDADQRYLIFQQQYPGLEQMIPQYHVAAYLGISATQLSRIRKKLVYK